MYKAPSTRHCCRVRLFTLKYAMNSQQHNSCLLFARECCNTSGRLLRLNHIHHNEQSYATIISCSSGLTESHHDFGNYNIEGNYWRLKEQRTWNVFTICEDVLSWKLTRFSEQVINCAKIRALYINNFRANSGNFLRRRIQGMTNGNCLVHGIWKQIRVLTRAGTSHCNVIGSNIM